MKKVLQLNGEKVSVEIMKKDAKSISFNWQGQEHRFEVVARHGHSIVLGDAQGLLHHLEVDGGIISGISGNAEFSSSANNAKAASAGGGDLTAPMPGKVYKILVKPGDKVEVGQTLLILEAMKMEHAIKAGKAGVVKKILFKEGDLVQANMPLAEVE